MNSEAISIDVTLTEKEVLLCKYRLLLNKPQYGVMTGMSICGLIYFILILLDGGIEAIDFFSDFPKISFGVFFPAITVFELAYVWLKNKNEFKGEKTLEINFFFSEFGITTVNKKETNISWNKIYEIKESRNNFIIYLSDTSLLFVPKRYFKDNEQIKTLRNIMTEKVPKKKLSLKK